MDNQTYRAIDQIALSLCEVINVDRRNRKSIEAIQTAMLGLLKEKPLEKIIMTEIAQRADINRSTLYSYFDNPQEVFSSLVEKSIAALNEQLGDKKYTMTEFIRLYLRHMKNHYIVYREIHRHNITDSHVLQIAEIMNEHTVGTKLIPDSIKAKYCFYGFFGVAAEWLENGCKEKTEHIIEELMPIMELFDIV